MRAIAIQEFGGRGKLQLMDLPVPALEAQEVLIRIKAAGVNPVDWKIERDFYGTFYLMSFRSFSAGIRPVSSRKSGMR